jgi:hypothetical protein
MWALYQRGLLVILTSWNIRQVLSRKLTKSWNVGSSSEGSSRHLDILRQVLSRKLINFRNVQPVILTSWNIRKVLSRKLTNSWNVGPLSEGSARPLDILKHKEKVDKLLEWGQFYSFPFHSNLFCFILLYAILFYSISFYFIPFYFLFYSIIF